MTISTKYDKFLRINGIMNKVIPFQHQQQWLRKECWYKHNSL